MVYSNQLGVNKGIRTIHVIIMAAVFSTLLVLGSFTSAFATSHAPSSNEANKTNGWAYVDVTSQNGEATITFNSTRAFYSCFEYRTDGDTSQKIGDTNYAPGFDGLYPYKCVNSSTAQQIVSANEYVEVRLAFGAEADERFDWTRFEVEQPPVAETKEDCKNGGFAAFGFKNQGLCIASLQSNDNSKHQR